MSGYRGSETQPKSTENLIEYLSALGVNILSSYFLFEARISSFFFQSLEVVDRSTETQLQVAENFN